MIINRTSRQRSTVYGVKMTILRDLSQEVVMDNVCFDVLLTFTIKFILIIKLREIQISQLFP